MPKRKRYSQARLKLQNFDSNHSSSDSGGDDDLETNSLDINYGIDLDKDEMEEVLPVVDDTEEEDENEDDNDYQQSEVSDEDDDGDKQDADNTEAWGKRKSTYFSTDFVDEDRGRSYREEDKEMAMAEEADALAIQNKFMDQVPMTAFEADQSVIEKPVGDETENKASMTATDWSSVSKKKKIQIVSKSSPEFIPTLHEFQKTVTELSKLLPKYISLTKADKEKENIERMKTRMEIMLQYSVSASFYLVMKASHQPLINHPVLDEMNTLHNLLREFNDLDSGKKQVAKPARKKLRTSQNAKSVQQSATDKGKENELKDVPDRVDPDLNAAESNPVEDESGHEKRSVTYQIAKNKGLTPHRKKEYRNPRVRHRMKFKKAQIRRKGQVRAPRTESQRYGGEFSGIQPNVTRSIKFK